MALKSVLITGTSEGGIGAALAYAFQKRGFLVFATARNVSKIPESLASLPNVKTFALDVTSAASISAAIETVKAETAGNGLDILVNNSGCGITSPVLDVDMEQAKALFEVNFWGVLAMIKAFAPFLVETKGAIVNVGSIVSQMYLPYIGLYAASKAALINMGECLRLEMAPLGVRVVTVVTGVIGTKFQDNMPDVTLPPGSYYAPVEQNVRNMASGKPTPKPMNVDIFAGQVVSDILSGANGKLWRGNLATAVRFASAAFPSFITDRMWSDGKGLDKLTRPKSVKS